MAIQFQCPICGSEFHAPDEFAGQQARCGGCQNVVGVPAANAPVALTGHSTNAAAAQRERLLPGYGIVGGAVAVIGLLVALLAGGLIAMRLGKGRQAGAEQRVPAPLVSVAPPESPAWALGPDPPEDTALIHANVSPQTVLPARLFFSRHPSRVAIAELPGDEQSSRPRLQVHNLDSGAALGKSVEIIDPLDPRASHRDLSASGAFFVAAVREKAPPTIHVFTPLEGKLRATFTLADSVDDKFGLALAGSRRLLTAHLADNGEVVLQLQDLIRTEVAPTKIVYHPQQNERFDFESLAISPGGRYAGLLTQFGDNLAIWDLYQGQIAARREFPRSSLWPGLAFSPDGKRLAKLSLGQPGYQLTVLNLENGQPTISQAFHGDLKGNQIAYQGPRLEWSASGQHLLFCGQDLIDAQTGKLVDAIRHDHAVASQAWCRIAEGDMLLHSARTFYAVTPLSDRLGPPPVETAPAKTVASATPNEPVEPSADPPELISSAPAPVATVIKPDPPMPRPEPAEPAPADSPATEVAKDAPAAREAVWTLALDPPAAPPTFKSGKFSVKIDSFDEILFPPGPSRFCLLSRSGGSEPRHLVVDLVTGKPIGKEVTEPELRDRQPVLSSDGRYLADFFPSNREIGVWSFATGEQVLQLPKSEGSFEEFTFAGPHQLAVVYSEDIKLHLAIWDVRTGKQLRQTMIRDDSASGDALALAPSPGGKYLAVLAEHDLLIVDVAQAKVIGQRSLRYLGDRSAIRLFGAWLDLSHVECDGVAWSATGNRLALTMHSGLDGFLVCLDAANGGVVFERLLRKDELGHHDFRDEDKNPLDWTPDGSAILVGGTRLYDGQTGKDLYTLPLDPTADHAPRRIIRLWDVLTIAEGADGEDYLATLPLPKDALSKALEQTRGAGEAVDSLLPPLTMASYDGLATINPGLPAGEWQSLADGVAPAADLPDRLSVVEGDRYVRRVRFASGGSGKLAAVTFKATSDGRNTTSSLQIQQVDARTKKRGPAIEIAPQYELADVSPDGQFALLRFGDAPLRHERLDLVGLNPKKHVAGWRPYSDENATDAARGEGKAKNIQWAALIDGTHALTLSEAGRLILWQLPECRAVWQISGVMPHVPIALSPGRRFMGLRIGSRLALVESLTGKVLANPEVPLGASIAGYAFRPDGREVYLFYSTPGQAHHLRRLDADTGAVLGESILGFPNLYLTGPHNCFRNDNTAVIGDSMLVDLERSLLLWRYVLDNHQVQAEHSPDGRLWYCRQSGAGPTELIAVDPYRSEVRAATRDLAPADQYVLRQGDRVRLVVDLAGAGLDDRAEQIRGAVSERLAAAGLLVDPAAAVTLAIRGSERTQTNTFRRNNGQVLSFPDVRVALRLSITDAEGRVQWGYEVLNAPVIDLSRPLEGQAGGDEMAKKRASVVAMATHPDFVRTIPTVLSKDPRDILPGESLLGPGGLAPLPAEKRLPPRVTGLERADAR